MPFPSFYLKQSHYTSLLREDTVEVSPISHRANSLCHISLTAMYMKVGEVRSGLRFTSTRMILHTLDALRTTIPNLRECETVLKGLDAHTNVSYAILVTCL